MSHNFWVILFAWIGALVVFYGGFLFGLKMGRQECEDIVLRCPKCFTRVRLPSSSGVIPTHPDIP